MLRILHLADIHLGMENYGHVDPATRLSSRLGDFLRSLDAALDHALRHEFDLVVVAGDIYKNRDPTPTVQREFARRVRRLSEAGIPTFILVGNHDLPNASERAHTVEIFDTLGVPHVTVARRPQLFTVPTAHGPVQIAALPWVTYNQLLTKEEFRLLSNRELNGAVVDRIEKTIDDMVERLDPALPTIFTAHAGIDIAKTSSEHTMMLGDDFVLPLSMVARPEFDYVAMGHIHKYQVLHSHPPVVYPGSLERIDFGEERDQKGFVTVTLDETQPRGARNAQHEFHDSGARRFLTVEVHTNGGNPNESVLRALAAKADVLRDSVVRLVIKTTAEQEGQLRDDEIRKALAPAHFIASISREIETQRRTRLGDQAIEQLTPRQALQIYLSTTNTPADRTETLLQYADTLLGDHSDS